MKRRPVTAYGGMSRDYRIDWTLDARAIQRFVHAVGPPYASAKTTLDGRTIRLVDVEIVEDVVIENRCPGKVIFLTGGHPIVVCGSGLLRLLDGFYEDDGTPLIPLTRMRCRFE